jgi:uncharacterized membrane protein YhfC
MVNPYLLIAQIGMILVGLVAIFWWKSKKKVGWKYFGFGALVWIIAISLKVAMDLTITPSIAAVLNSYGTAVLIAGIGLYVGLRTGFFESGFSYIVIAKTRFRKMNLNQAMAFGIGFGSIEAIFLGLSGAINIVVFILNPSLVSSLPAATQASLDLPTITVLAPIIERIFTLLIHVFSSLLVVYAVVNGKIRYLWYSILFKSLVDGMIPALTSLVNTATVVGLYEIEIPIAILGIFSFYGIKRASRKFKA